ncbi:MFS transporter [Fluoribacter dumoffii]|uniref:Lysosomal dipeptide transporter MFSD1 n=1 Tax=Fluoribacter dumoffii TaxID=463 RepID=A0A377GC48_9GAMM|nr:MFS transporter [Fluoribacter dumoffii]KTC90711.1 major facilitator family transporter [Fluoribacter dumoffii NY 23]MCW8386391.1 MFS transporter [Fluoribacter dumoffii]MCW8419444.1 MFS transporter [Fluoribacter dumoffii]MCW8452681.1 MFS transporter [Fluoribacter dumoffii]MCW8460069.1 MFS transporter [Fluoribacter dumoffii]
MSQSITVNSSTFVPRGDLMAWVVCLSAGLFFLYEFFQLNIFDVINQPLRDDFHIDATQLSWMSSAYLWADILFLLPAGIILDRFSTRTVILSAMFICVLGTVGFALTHSFILASFCHFLSGIGNAFCFLSCVVLVSHWFPPRRQALVIGSLVTMAFVGGMMAHTPFAYLYELFGWRKALLIDGAVGAVLLLWIYWVVRDKPEDSPAKMNTNQGQVISGFIKALSNSQNWLAGFYTSFLNLPIMVLCALWGASYLQVVHHLPEMAASNVVSLIFMGSVIGCPLAGWLSDSQGRRKPLMIAGAIATLVTVIPLFLDIALSQTTLSVIFFALGFFTSTQVITYPLVAESNSTDNTGAATGIASVIIMGGGGVGQVLFGWLITHHAGASVANYTVADFQYAMWMFPITTVAALLAVLITRETYCKR